MGTDPMIPLKVYIAAGAVAVVIAATGLIYWQGGKDARAKGRMQDAIENSRTLERIGNATTDDRDADDIDRRLRELSE